MFQAIHRGKGTYKLVERLSGRIDLDNFSFRNSMQLVRKNRYLPLKRIIDWVVSLMLLLILTPFMVLIFVIIALESKNGPIFSPTAGWNRGQAIHNLQIKDDETRWA